MKTIYLDEAATTRVSPEVFRAMRPYFLKKYGNPSEFHTLGRQAREVVESSRAKVAHFLGASSQEIIFTGSATESINLAIKGLVESVRLARDYKPHLITSVIEHKAVLETCRHLERSGQATVTYLPVDRYGRVTLESLKKALIPQTLLVSIGYVNNEVGTVQSISEIGQLIKKINKSRVTSHQPPIYFHTDATQAIVHLNCQVKYLGVDLLSLTGHKIGAPKGIGALFIKEGVEIIRQMDGGSQEEGLRAGTENVPYIAGLGKAIEVAQRSKTNGQRLIRLRDDLIKNVLKIPKVRLTGHPIQRAPHIASFIVEGVEGEAMVLRLSDLGIFAASGSACTSGDLRPSHVLTGMGIMAEKSHGSLRFSLRPDTTKVEIDYVIAKLPKVIADLRAMTPKYG